MKIGTIKAEIEIVEILEQKGKKKDGSEFVKNVMTTLVKGAEFGQVKSQLIEIVYEPDPTINIKTGDLLQVELAVGAYNGNATFRALSYQKIK